ncbi:MAG TPA: hypothetical protein VH682_18665 [Gemmataceae bacterium]|jgi:hypothetical protein
MTEQELILALRELIAKAAADAPDPRLLAREISRRDQMRIRLLAGLSIFFWLLAAAGLVLLCVGLDRFVIYVRIMDYDPIVPSSDHGWPLDPRTQNMLRGTNLIHHTIWLVAGSAVSLFLGALCTVLLVTTSRRATLGQINLSLMELSEQLKQLRAANPSEKIHKPENP